MPTRTARIRPGTPLTVVIASPLEPRLVDRIRAVDPELRVVHEPDLIPSGPYAGGYVGSKPALDEAGIGRWRAILGEADIMFDLDWLEPARMPVNAPRLQWVQASKSGIGEGLRRLGLDRSGITFCTAAGVHAVPLAEWVVFGLLYLVKDVPGVLALQARHEWHQYPARSLSGTRALVVGLGGVGREVARTLALLGVEVWGVRRSSAAAPEGVARLVPPDGMRAALGDVDWLILACPYTAETHHLIGAAELAVMRPGAGLLNIARGAVVDQPALVAALRSGPLGGAVLDVTEKEPMPADDPLWELPNVLISPHRASIVDTEDALIVDLFIDNLRRHLDGRPLRNVYDPDREY